MNARDRRPLRPTALAGHLEVDIEKLVPGGLGLARHTLGTFLVPRVCPGEAVTIDPGSTPARLIEVRRSSADRVEPPCALSVRCGGCDLMHLSVERQAEVHAEIAREVLAHAVGEPVPEARVHRASAFLGYRTRARLAFVSSRGKLVLGYREDRSRDIVDVERCAVLDARLESALALCRDVLKSSRASGEISLALGARGLPVMDVRTDGDIDGPVAANLHRAVEAGRLAGARVLLGQATSPLSFGDPRIVQTGADGEPVFIGAGGFAQTSERGAAVLATRVAELALPVGKRIVELFLGSGTLSILLAKGAETFVGVEIDREAAVCTRANLDARGLRAKIVVADADAYAIPPCDVVVLDPPRTGAKRATAALATARPKRIVYVACDPVTLGRDVAVLARAGYRIASIDTVELFPQTSHVETIVVLDRRPRDDAGTPR